MTGDNVGLLLVRPRPGSDRAVVAAVAGTGPAGPDGDGSASPDGDRGIAVPFCGRHQDVLCEPFHP